MSSCLALQKRQHNLEEFCTSMRVSLTLPTDLQTTGLRTTSYTPSHTYSCLLMLNISVCHEQSCCNQWDCFLREALLNMSKNITAWERMEMCNETKHQYLSHMPPQRSWNLVDITVSAALWVWGQIGCPSHSQDTILLFFKKSLVPLPDTSLPSPSLKGLGQKAVSYQNSSSLKPVEGFLQQGTITPQSASTALLSLFSLQVYSQALSPKHRGTEARQLTEIKSDISTICLKMWDHWLISFI